MPSKLTTAEEVKIVALLARGDTAAMISDWMRENMGRTVTGNTVGLVKKRNMENIAMLKKKLMIVEERNALSIKAKANRIIDKRLDTAEIDEDARRALNEQLANGEIEYKDWLAGIKKLRTIALGELVSVSKEMHAQSIDDPDATKPDTSKTLAALAKALESGDTLMLNQLIFNKGGDDGTLPSVLPEPIQADASSERQRGEAESSPQDPSV